MNPHGLSTPPETDNTPAASGRTSGSRRGRRQNPPALKRALIVMGCGLALIGAGAVPLTGEISTAMANSPSVQGTVVDVRFSEPEEGKEDTPLSCTPVAGYTVEGQGYNASSNDFTADCDWAIGQEVKVAYDPDNPVEARIVTEEFNPMTLILPGSGTVIAAGGLLMLMGAQRNKKRS